MMFLEANLKKYLNPGLRRTLVLSGFALLFSGLARAQSIPTYSLKSDIPPLQVGSGSVLRFKISTSDLPSGTHLRVDAEPRPAGPLVLDPVSGEFSYRPDPKDLFQFTLTLSAVSTDGSIVISKKAAVTPIPPLPAEFQTLFTRSDVPRPDNQIYISILEQAGTTKEFINTEERIPYDISIIGDILIFDASNDANGLYTRFGHRLDLRNVLIVADTLIIRTRWQLPDASVHIYARKLIFEDSGPDSSTIDITPRSNWGPAKPASLGVDAKNGADGHSARSLLLDIHELVSPTVIPRFIARGGDGQDGGVGRNGADGVIHMPEPGQPGYVGFPTPALLANIGVKEHVPAGTVFMVTTSGAGGTKAWPDNGDPAQPPGKPGEAGSGGEIVSSIPLDPGLTDCTGGRPGKQGSPTSGGKSGTPKHAVWAAFYAWNNIQPTDQHDAKDGSDASAPAALAPKGPDGRLDTKRATKSEWIHPRALRTVIDHARDLYINGHLTEAANELRTYADLLESSDYRGSQFASEIAMSQLEIVTLLQRIASNKDYFGNPAGWTPLLSFETRLSAFRDQVNTAIPIMFTHYWISKRASDIVSTNAGLTESINQLEGLLTKDKEALGGLEINIVKLQDQIRAISRETAEIQKAIAAKEKELEQRAIDNVKDRHKESGWKDGLKCLGTICEVIPVYQPALAAVGQGLIVLSEAADQSPLITLQGLKAASDNLTAATFKQSEAQLTRITSNIDMSSPESLERGIKEIQPVAIQLSNAVDTIRKYTEAAQVPGSEVEAELARIKAESPELNDLINRVVILNAKKVAFNELLGTAAQQLAVLSENITKDVISIDSMGREKSLNTAALHPEVQIYVDEMDRRARDILLEYHYRLAKAYEYRLLKPYRRQLNLDKILNRFQEMVTDKNHGASLSPGELTEMKNIYSAILSEITADVLNELDNNPAKRSGHIVYDLSQTELNTLNSKNDVVIDLMGGGYVRDDQENLRIFNIEESQVLLNSAPDSDDATTSTLITFEPSSVTRLRSAGKLYLFRHSTSNRWGVDIIGTGPNIKPIAQKLSPSNDSLLVSVLLPNSVNGDPTKALAFSEPGLWGDIHVRKSVVPQSQRGAVTVSRLQLSIDYEFRDASNDEVVLQVQPPKGLNPYVEVASDRPEKTDLNGQEGGMGQLFRIYPVGTPLHIAAPAQLGRYTFLEWRSASAKGPIVSKNSAFDLPMDKSVTLFPIYVDRDSAKVQPTAVR
jgi:hypothetical protein